MARLVAGPGLILLCLLGCSGEVPRAQDTPTGAVLIGRVELAKGARLPSYAAADQVRRALIADGERVASLDAECAAAEKAARRPVTLGDRGALGGVVVAASDFTHYRPREPRTHTLRIEGCRLSPPVLSAAAGDRLVIDNADGREHVPSLRPSYRARPLAAGDRVVQRLAAGLEAVLCARDRPCGRADVLTFHHPVHAVTAEDGSFRIEDFPVGEMVRVSAWHPLFKEARAHVWLEPGEQRTVRLVLKPRRRRR
ncbi:MAG: hypothetical protein OXT09_05645 [Myxococcales bacterium]|nr:hypothetical protein [Myxococcales bacterium]